MIYFKVEVEHEKGFTLIELLATIVVLAVISMITIGVVTNNIEASKQKTFEINASNLLDATKEYVSKNMENNDFPVEGIEAKSKKLELKNNPFISGIVKRNKEGQIELENVTDGTYCANGVKSKIKISKGNCESLDNTPPSLKIKELKTTRTEINLMIKTQDSGSGIKEYEYCLNNECTKVTKNKEKGIITEAKKIKGLKPNTKYTIKVTSTNGKNQKTTKTIEVKTKELEIPTFKISSNTYATTKELIITYPEVEKGYVKKYKRKEEIKEVKEKEVKIEIKEEETIRAYIEKEGTEIVYNEIIVGGIDKEGPVVNVTIPDIDKWTQSKTIQINATDIGVGIALRPYSYDGGKNWIKSNKKTLTTSQKLNIKSRDRLGNSNKTFKINGTTECCVDCDNLCAINNIDSIGPDITITVIEGTKINNPKYNDWYNSNTVKVRIEIKDYYSVDNQKILGGSGVNENSIRITAPASIQTGTTVRYECINPYYPDIDHPENKVCGGSYREIKDPIYTYGYRTFGVNESVREFRKISNYVYELVLSQSKVNNISVQAKDNVGNISYKSSQVKIDNKAPSIKNEKDSLSLGTEDYNFIDNISVTYGPTGGTSVCDPATTKKKGTYTVTCTATGNNGKTGTTTFEAKHSYKAHYRTVPKCKSCYNTHDCYQPSYESWRNGTLCTYDCSDGHSRNNLISYMNPGSDRWDGRGSSWKDCEEVGEYYCDEGATLKGTTCYYK